MLSHQKQKTIETESFSVKGNLISWENTIIQISNITLISTEKLKTPSFLLGIILIVCGILALNLSSSVGWVVLLLGVAQIVFAVWKKRKMKNRRYLNFILNSGTVFTLLFQDKPFLDETLSVLTGILSTSARDEYVTINIKNQTVTNAGKVENIQNINNNISHNTIAEGASIGVETHVPQN